VDIEQIKDLMSYLENSSLRKMVVQKKDFSLLLEKEHAHVDKKSFEEKTVAQPVLDVPKEPVLTKDRSVLSPMVGTFYASASPEQEPFVKVGDRVEEDTVVCIIEAMKVMNEVKAGMKGMVAEVLVENAQSVEFETPLFRIV
jgi:acetyl-CoA carboxylase biotin carboxyl carrier protein